jgi:hypothetical protein
MGWRSQCVDHLALQYCIIPSRMYKLALLPAMQSTPTILQAVANPWQRRSAHIKVATSQQHRWDGERVFPLA